ncbi:MAG: hypothetical protein IVW57_07080 [Ktedonobacterales bacterium]|nr:hypothetical protein [Ktedonobacterales bacterium]
MEHALRRGLLSGAVGTLTLNVTTYADMALRGRASSETPGKVVGLLADKMGLATIGTGAQDETARNRRSGVGALLGYATGLAVGTVYGLLRARRRGRVSTPIAGAIVGILAMVASDTPIVATGASDPRGWGVSGWAADVIPHLAYGLTTVAVYEVLASRE